MCDLTRWSIIRNGYIKESSGVRNILAGKMGKNRLRWFGLEGNK